MRSTRHSLLFFLLGIGFLVSAGATGAREPFFPRVGDRGYDALHYGAVLSYQRRDGSIRVHEWIQARANSALSSFSLDLHGLRVLKVWVDGSPARFERGRQKLTVRVPDRIGRGDGF